MPSQYNRYFISRAPMRGGWKVPALYLVTTGQISLGFIHPLSVIGSSFDSSSHFSGLTRSTPGCNRRMSTEVRADEDFGPTDQSWRSLLEVSMAKSRKTRGSNYVQISTVNKDGEPRCRTVVFRGFLNNANLSEDHPMSPQNGGHFDGKPCVMKMCTDLRSQKVGEIAHQPISEMVRTLLCIVLSCLMFIWLLCQNVFNRLEYISQLLMLSLIPNYSKRFGGFPKPASSIVFEDP